MAIGTKMMNQEEEIRSKNQQEKDDDDDDDHKNDMVMPGFRFHPTEEELVEFYLRRKVEGKRFNIELITFLDLYKYDPWELPALAAIGEKEWFFYVPRDRKYRNGDRPNRVTTSGYWKATGADRMIRNDNLRSIGLKKTLVFYSGKAPKGIRSSWIMNEYRLPQHETERLQKAEISLCRVYNRTGIDDHPSHSRSLHTMTASISRPLNYNNNNQNLQNSLSFNCFEGQSSHHTDEKISDTSGSSSTTDIVKTVLALSNPITPYHNIVTANSSTIFPNTLDDLHRIISSQHVQDNSTPSRLLNIHNYDQVNASSSSYSPLLSTNNLLPQPDLQLQPHLHPQSLLALNNTPGTVQTTFSDRLWEWNSMPSEGSKDFTDPFK